MDKTHLGEISLPEKCSSIFPQIPGNLAPRFNFSIKDGKLYTAVLIVPFGPNPLTTKPILAWVEDGETIYSPTYFFKSVIAMDIWNHDYENFRLFTLYGNEGGKYVVKIYKEVEALDFEKRPLAVFKSKDSKEPPVTCIKKETPYGEFIYSISEGDLINSSRLITNYYEEITEAYPLLKNTIDNLILVYEDQGLVNWLIRNIAKKAEFRDIKASNFYELSLYFTNLADEKAKEMPLKYGKGILSLISKAFSFVPRN